MAPRDCLIMIDRFLIFLEWPTINVYLDNSLTYVVAPRNQFFCGSLGRGFTAISDRPSSIGRNL